MASNIGRDKSVNIRSPITNAVAKAHKGTTVTHRPFAVEGAQAAA
jgi:hypothetical protein